MEEKDQSGEQIGVHSKPWGVGQTLFPKLTVYIFIPSDRLSGGILLISARKYSEAISKVDNIKQFNYLGEASTLQDLLEVLSLYRKSESNRRRDVWNFTCIG